MDMHKGFWILVLAIAAVLLAEYLVSRKKRLHNFVFDQSVSNISNGIADRLFQVILIPLYFSLFRYIHTHWALFEIRMNIWTGILLFVCIDFLWYWYHRLSHEISVLWGAHVVHHQSTTYNYTVALKITPFQAIIRYTVWGALPLAGFSPELTFLLIGLNASHQFLIHTELVGRLGWLEKVLVTPSHHRVHHASNPAYLDKNYGGFLIIWDKLFGTFCEETEPVTYGITTPLRSHDFIYGYFHYWQKLWQAARQPGSWKQKLVVFLGRPGAVALPEAPGAPAGSAGQRLTRSVRIYTAVTMLLCVVMLVLLSVFDGQLHTQDVVFFYVFILLSLTGAGAMLEARKAAFFIEWIKLSALGCLYCFHIRPGYSVYPFTGSATLILSVTCMLVVTGLAVTFHNCYRRRTV